MDFVRAEASDASVRLPSRIPVRRASPGACLRPAVGQVRGAFLHRPSAPGLASRDRRQTNGLPFLGDDTDHGREREERTGIVLARPPLRFESQALVLGKESRFD